MAMNIEKSSAVPEKVKVRRLAPLLTLISKAEYHRQQRLDDHCFE
jgi:hypothetical protein